MASLFIIGNGFDIAHGLNTRYSDFRSFLINLYPEALSFKDEIVYLEDFMDIDSNEFAAEILLNVMDKAAGEDWRNFEEALAYINFNNKLPAANHKEDETDEDDMELMGRYLLYMDVLTSGFITCSKIWQEFFRAWIKDIQKKIDYEMLHEKDSLKDLFLQPDAKFINFNYTKTLQKLYGIKKVIHIHNRVGQKLIFGHGKDNISYGDFDDSLIKRPFISSSFLDDMIMSFRKDTKSPMKKYNHFFKELNSKVDRVYSYGFSYGKVDCIYIKEIVRRISPEAVWHFTSFEANDIEGLRIKKIKLRKYGFKGSFSIFD